MDTSSILNIAATDAVKAEGNSGLTAFTFTVTKAGFLGFDSSAAWTVTGSGANAGDFGGALPSGTVTFASGQTTALITVYVSGDTALELNESFIVTLSQPVESELGTSTATGTIQNDDTPAVLALSGPVSLAEGNAGSTAFNFTVTRTGDTSGASSANYAVTGSGANAADFVGGVLPSGTVTFAAGQSSKVVTVNVAGDTAFEANENFTVTLSGASGAVLGTATTTGTIVNDDAQATLSIAATDANKAEGDPNSVTPLTFTVTRTGDTTGASSATWEVIGSGGGHQAGFGDFLGPLLPKGTVTFAAGETSKLVTVAVTGDSTFEFDETFDVTLSGAAGAVLGTATATGTIINDDIAPTLAISGPTNVTEGNSGPTAVTYVVTRTGDMSVGTSANYTVIPNSANPAAVSDFVGGVFPSGTVTFAPWQTTSNLIINVAGDTALEPNEGFTVTLSNPAFGTVIGAATATSTIVNDDTAPILKISGVLSLAEGASGSTDFVFTATRSGDTTVLVSAFYQVYPAQFDANPTTAGDFVGGALPTGVLIFGPGETSKTVTISVAGDTSFEPDETFLVILTSGFGGASIDGSSMGFGTILNDDPGPTLAISGPLSLAEGDGGSTAFVYTVTRSGDTTGATSVNYAVTGSGANPAAAGDFTSGTLPTGTVTFAAGETSKQVTINVAGDTTFEANEGFAVTLSGATTGAVIGSAATTGTILNDDSQAALSIAATDATKPEGDAGSTAFTFTVTRSGDTSGASSATWTATGSGAAPATTGDFAGGILPTGTVSFAAGETSKLVTVNVAGDTSLEPDEGFTVTLSAAIGAALGTAAATGAILNDDTAPNLAPVAVADIATVAEDASVIIDVLANDTDPDAGDGKSLVSVSTSAKGASVVISDGQVVYTADPDAFDLLHTGQSATDSFTYVMRDAAGLTSSSTVTVTINGVAEGATKTGGTGNDSLAGTALDEKLDGAAGHDTLGGGEGADILVGGAGNDLLLGGAGIDSLSAGDGNDTLEGGPGDDILAGGRGLDLFSFGPAFGHDTLIDFRPGEDHVAFQGAGLTSFADLTAHAAQVGANVLITLGSGDSLQLNGVTLASLAPADFLFV